MLKEDLEQYFRMLELAPDASLQDVRNSYQLLKSLYSESSIETSAIDYDLTYEKKQEILRQIDEAYEKLARYFGENKTAPEPSRMPVIKLNDETRKYIDETAFFSGPVLRRIREMAGVDLKNVVILTKIRRQFFEDIENERFSSFPAEIYLRGYIMEYARYLSLDPVRVADDYINRYRQWKVLNAVKTI